jgi:hypothetical protein
MKRLPALLVALVLVVLPLSGPSAQDVPTAAPPAGTLRVFVDCNSGFCDFDFFRREIGWVDYVRDRQDADVHVLVTTQRTGSGGTEFTLRFIGQRRFAGRSNTLGYTSAATATADEVRRGLVRILKAGLVPYAVDTPVGSRITIGYEAPAAEAAAPATPARDPWNFWTFTVGVNGFFNGEDQFNSSNLSGSASANRTTEAWKIEIAANSRYSESNFELSDSLTITNIQRNYGARTLVVRSLTPHLSAGGRASVNSSTFLNQDLAIRIAPAVEYNLYPYSESSRRRLTAQYSVGANRFDYDEQTIFGETEETRFDQALVLAADFTQPWGSIDTSLGGSTFLDDFSKNRLDLGGGVNLQLVKGLRFRVGGSASRVRDQIYLPAGNLTPEQILLRQRALATGFRYFGSVGISYTFGSIFNNVVNPRFRGGEGGGTVIFF